jgi:hypothetical protein
MALSKKLLLVVIIFILFLSVNSFSQELNLKTKNVLLDKEFLSNIASNNNKSFLKVLDDQDYREFFVINFEESKYDTVIGRLMVITRNVRIWVDTISLNRRYVTADELEVLREYLETRTDEMSHDSNKGIIQLVTECFGKTPNVDERRIKGQGDGAIHFLLTDIKDGLLGNNEYIPGYFNPHDVDTNGVVSNKMDLIYLDTYPGIFYQGIRNVRRILPTVAHELQHLIHWNYDPEETSFINVSMSFLSEIICGLKTTFWPVHYFSNTDIPLFDWDETYKNINESRAALFGAYLKEQCGIDFIKYLVSNTNTGKEGIDSALVSANVNMTFEMLFTNWAIANYLDDKNIDSRYGYGFKLNAQPIPRGTHINPTLSSQGQALKPLAPMYIKYTKAESLTVIFSFNSNVVIKALEIGNSRFSTHDIRTNYGYIQNSFGSIYNNIVFLCISFGDDNSNSDLVTYSSYGKEADKYSEIFYDDGEPDNYGLSEEVGFKRFVRFRMPVGKRLDSVKFAFMTTGTFLFHLYRTTDTSIIATDNIIVPIMSTATEVFPVWTKVDLTGYGIIPNYDIAAGYETLASTVPHPILWGDNTVVRNRSIVYSPSTGLWSSVATNYMIRAYLSDLVLNVEREPDIIPEKFKLYQNYPNPFNGITTIEFDLKERGNIKLKLFDLLGTEVITLVDNNFEVGRYSVRWNGKNKYGVNVSSGMYIYSLETFGKRVNRKLIYLR